MIGEHVGSYRIVDKLGEGGMGVVYAAEHVELGHHVAVKILRAHFTTNADIVQRFFNEARAATRVRHPGIVQIFDFGRLPDGTVYFVMELLDGESLGDRMERGLLLEPYAAAIARQVAGALGAAHAVRIVHRDLKPDNIVIVADPDVPLGERAKVLDFGIAKLVDMQGQVSLRTQTGSVMGTPYYMSPEQSRGAGEIDHRSDIYSLGCILFEMVCGQPPFLSDGLGEVIGMHQFVAPPRPRAFNEAVSEELEAIVLRALAKKPDERFPTMEALATALAPLTVGAVGMGVVGRVIDTEGSGAILMSPMTSDAPTGPPPVPSVRGTGPSPRITPEPRAGTGPSTAIGGAAAAGAAGSAAGSTTGKRTAPEAQGAVKRAGEGSTSRPGAGPGSVTTLRDATGESLTMPGDIHAPAPPRLRRVAWLGGVAALVAAGSAAAVVKLAGSEESRPVAADRPAVKAAIVIDAGVGAGAAEAVPDAAPILTARDVAAAQAQVLLDEITRNQARREWRDVLELYERLPVDADVRAHAAPARAEARTAYLAAQKAAIDQAVAASRCDEASSLATELFALLPEDGDAARLGEIAATCVEPSPDAPPGPVSPSVPARIPASRPGPAPRPAVATVAGAELALRQGDARKALRLAEDVLRRTPRDVRALTVAGLASCNAGNAAKARRYGELLGTRASAMRTICARQGIALPGGPAVNLPETPTAADVTRALGAVRSRLAACGADYRATSTVRVRLVIGADGRVREAKADAAPKVAWCMEGIARAVRFPASRKGMTVNYPVTLR